ncbi:hypothetical protein MTsPCn9_01570 [Croceitalea sp. MTPC9]|uniref:hypothetical protein n=1 Tax=unclassified Croceitalea TaxID=2632280 RepID=UPI002B36791A|nr:hypothetical protein MTsPCn6_07140 [Croceitalea sp. MTPC6]GMN15221.1 hypothetical protein MTsPCn9_01570 [Croceitalea sp. MTPC9]
MKRNIFLIFSIVFLACSDGDLQIETLDFDSVNVQNCGTLNSSTEIFFKINGDEALILDLPSGDLNNGNSVTDTTTTESTIPSQSQLTYRIFSDNVSSSYFCDDIPPSTPTVIEEIDAQEGLVIIKSIANSDSTAINHIIELSGITLINSNGERITDLSINEFGELNIPSN